MKTAFGNVELCSLEGMLADFQMRLDTLEILASQVLVADEVDPKARVLADAVLYIRDDWDDLLKGINSRGSWPCSAAAPTGNAVYQVTAEIPALSAEPYDTFTRTRSGLFLVRKLTGHAEEAEHFLEQYALVLAPLTARTR